MNDQLTVETLTEFFAPLEDDCGIDPGELAEAFLSWPKFAAHNDAIVREAVFAERNMVKGVMRPADDAAAARDEGNLFDQIKAKAKEIAAFHAVTNGVTYTEDEWLAVDIGMSVGVHAAIEHFTEAAS